MIHCKFISLQLTIYFLFTIVLTEQTTHNRQKRQFSECSSPRFRAEFEGPTVHLTISSLVSLENSGQRVQERQLELNWHRASPMIGDWVGLFAQDPSLNRGLGPALDRVDVNGNPSGTYRTSITFPRPTFGASTLRNECLGFWIAYVRANRSLTSQCLHSRPSWMWDNRSELGSFKLSDLVLPGTHDSGSYQEYRGRSSENVITRYTICQDEDIWNQLAYGIRYLDFRVGLYTTTRERLWLNHGDFKVNPLQRALADLSAFLNTTREIVILDIHRFQWGFDSIDHHREIITLILRELEPFMVPRASEAVPTLSDLWTINKRLLVAYNNVAFLESPLLWPGIPQRWGDKNDISSLQTYLQNVMQSSNVGLWVAMAELTPNTADIIRNPNGSLRNLADQVNKKVSNWVSELWWDKSNIVATDFFLSNNVIDISIEANLRRKLCGDRFAPAPAGPPSAPIPSGSVQLPLSHQPNSPPAPARNQQLVPELGPRWAVSRYPPPIPQPIVSGQPPYRQLGHRLGLER